MNVVNFNERSCERYRRYFDAYLDNELLVETNQDVLQHLTTCEDCSRILESRSRVKQMVKQAVTAEQVPLALAQALQHQFQSRRRLFFFYHSAPWLAAAAVILLAVAGLGTLEWEGLFNRSPGRSGTFPSIAEGAQKLLRIGLVDHIHCAILGRKWQQFISFDEMKADTSSSGLGPQFIDLVPAVQNTLGPDFKMIEGHRCTAGDREYIHLIMTGRNGAILSVVITEKNNESFRQTGAIAVTNASGVPVYSASQGQLEIAGFESGKYLAYIVSNLDRQNSLNVASLLVPVVYDHLRRLEA